MEATTDLWELPAESATRVGHPAPFPVELPERFIELFTYRDDLVLDPFMGSGTTAAAAVRTERHFAGYDTDEDYVLQSKRRVEAERQRLAGSHPHRVVLPGRPDVDAQSGDAHARALREGLAARDVARGTLAQCGFVGIEEEVSFPEGIDVSFVARDQHDRPWHVDVAGGFTSGRAGLRRAEVLWKVLAKAAVLASARPGVGLVVLTTAVPAAGSAGDSALRALVGAGKPIRDVIVLTSEEDVHRLRELASGAPFSS
jgi:site-specific DNA-methyltransferase (adenine-specific)